MKCDVADKRPLRILSLALALALTATAALACAPTAFAHDHHHAHPSAASTEASPVTMTPVAITIPKATLTRHDGRRTDLASELQGRQPVYVNFVFTTCTTVCPLTSQIFADLQAKLVARGTPARFISITIDPEHDTKSRLAAYARQFGAGRDWHFYTGTVAASAEVQKAFGTWTQDKMNHPIVTYFRPEPELDWIRIDGFATPDQLVEAKTAGH